jgi:hypothetical protein
MAVRMSALRAGRSLPPKNIPGTLSVRGWVDPRAIVQLEGLGKSKISNDLIGNWTRDLQACNIVPRCRDSVLGIVNGYKMDGRGVGVRVPVWSRIFSSPCCQDRLWGSPNLLSNGYRGYFSRGSNNRGVKVPTYLQQVPRSRKCGSIHPLPIRLHGVVLN